MMKNTLNKRELNKLMTALAGIGIFCILYGFLSFATLGSEEGWDQALFDFNDIFTIIGFILCGISLLLYLIGVLFDRWYPNK